MFQIYGVNQNTTFFRLTCLKSKKTKEENRLKEFRLSTTSEEEPDFEVPSSPQLTSEFAPGDFLVVKVFGKKSFRLYVVKVLYPEDEGYVGQFYKRVPHLEITRNRGRGSISYGRCYKKTPT